MARTIRDLMTPNPVCLDASTTVTQAAQEMKTRDIGNVLVQQDGKLCGIITDRDLVLRVLAEGRDPAGCQLGDICTRDLHTVSVDDDVESVVQMMTEKAIRRVPVVSSGRPVGIISLGDLAEDLDPRSALGEISAQPANNDSANSSIERMEAEAPPRLSGMLSLLLALLPPSAALADDGEGEFVADEEMIVEEAPSPEEAQAAVEQVLLSLGYRRGGTTRGGQTIYRPASRLHPTLLLDEEGFLVARGDPSRRVVVGSITGNRRRALGATAETLEALDPALDAWRAALQGAHMDVRYRQLPDRLAATWQEGAALDGHAPPGPGPAARRAVVLAFWASRADTPEGEIVRGITVDFLEAVVQPSPWPVTAEEQAAAEAQCRCGALFSPPAPHRTAAAAPPP